MSNSPDNEHQLIYRWRNGDERAFDQLFKLHFPWLHRLASRYIHDSELAREITMDVSIKHRKKRTR